MKYNLLLLFSLFGLSLQEEDDEVFYDSETYIGAAPGDPRGHSNNPDPKSWHAAITNPLGTVSVPMTVGSMTWTFRVNVTKAVDDYESEKGKNVVLTSYDIRWPGSKSLNDTFAAAEDLKPGRSKGTVYIGHATLLPAVTNDYDPDDPGNCAPVFGDECMKAFTNQTLNEGFNGFQLDWPKACRDRTGLRGPVTGSTALAGTTKSENSTRLVQPVSVGGWRSPHYMGDNETWVDREMERVHIFVIGGQKAYPVCARVKDTKVHKGDSATGDSGTSMVKPPVWVVGVVGLGGLLWGL